VIEEGDVKIVDFFRMDKDTTTALLEIHALEVCFAFKTDPIKIILHFP